MDRHLNVKRRVIFRRSADVLMAELAALKTKVVDTVKAEVASLKNLVEEQYAPFWKRRGGGGGSGGRAAADDEERLRKEAKEEVDDVVYQLEKIRKKAQLPVNEIRDYMNE